MNSKQKWLVRIACIVIALLLVLSVVAPAVMASEKEPHLEISTDVEYLNNDKVFITIYLDNQTGVECVFGWAFYACTVITDETTVETGNASVHIPEGESTVEVLVEDCPGTVQSISISRISTIGTNGLPDEEYTNVEIRDEYGSSFTLLMGPGKSEENDSNNVIEFTFDDSVISYDVITVDPNVVTDGELIWHGAITDPNLIVAAPVEPSSGGMVSIFGILAGIVAFAGGSIWNCLITGLGILLFVGSIAALVIAIILYTRRSRKAKKAFDPYKAAETTKTIPVEDNDDNGFAPPPSM